MAFIIRINGGMFFDRVVSTRTRHEDALRDTLVYYRKRSATPSITPEISFERTVILPTKK